LAWLPAAASSSTLASLHAEHHGHRFLRCNFQERMLRSARKDDLLAGETLYSSASLTDVIAMDTWNAANCQVLHS
jgi:hypothetical protein